MISNPAVQLDTPFTTSTLLRHRRGPSIGSSAVLSCKILLTSHCE
jgi:hypothetical protein